MKWAAVFVSPCFFLLFSPSSLQTLFPPPLPPTPLRSLARMLSLFVLKALNSFLSSICLSFSHAREYWNFHHQITISPNYKTGEGRKTFQIMDEHTAKKPLGGRHGVARRGPGLTSGEASNYKDGSRQCCNRLGCSTRFYSMKSSQVGTSDVAKNFKPSFRSTGSKSLVGSSSKKYSAVRDLRKPHQEPQKAVSASHSQGEMKVSEGVSSTIHVQPGFPETKDVEPEVLKGLSVDESEEVESCSKMRNAKKKKPVTERSELGNQNVASSSRRTFVSKSIRQAAKSATSGQGTNTSRYGLRKFGCTSISDVFPAGCSSSHLSHSGEVEAAKKNNDSFRGKINRSSSKESSGTSSNSMSNSNSGSECSSSPEQTSRTGNRPASKDATGSVRTRSVNGGNRARVSRHGKGSSLSLADSPVVPPQSPQNGLSIGRSSVNSSRNRSHGEHNTIRRNSYARPGQNGGSRNASNQRISESEDDPSYSFHDFSIGRGGFRRSNMEGIDEVLFALEMIEQDEELTHEQLFFLESNLFLGGLGFHDQHRDMRLDIDHMSYEELLALEEKMGSVSTALTEEVLLNCVKKSCYMHAPSFAGKTSSVVDEIKCSVCQEEYVEGDELGKLGCDHGYHLECIEQWLRQKNWCPICKSAAAPS